MCYRAICVSFLYDRTVNIVNIIKTIGFFAVSTLAAQLTFADQTIIIVQDVPTIEHVDLGTAADSSGDVTSFVAEITHEDGTQGTMHGLLQAVTTKQVNGNVVVKKHAQIVMDLGDGDTLIINGSASYPIGDPEMAANMSQLRAITGGTGRYVGARGQMKTTRKENGKYEHEVLILD